MPHQEVPTFACKVEDLGSKMARTLTDYARTSKVEECGVGLVQVVNLPRPNLVGLSYDDLPDRHKAIKFSTPSKGSIMVTKATIKSFNILNLTIQELPSLSHIDLGKVFERIASKPPDGSVGYFIGITRSQENIYEPLLNSGEVLREAFLHDVSGVTTNNDFYSVAGMPTATPMHKKI